MAKHKITKISVNVRKHREDRGNTIGITFHRENPEGESVLIRPDGRKHFLNNAYHMYDFSSTPIQRAKRLALGHRLQEAMFYRQEQKRQEQKA